MTFYVRKAFIYIYEAVKSTIHFHVLSELTFKTLLSFFFFQFCYDQQEITNNGKKLNIRKNISPLISSLYSNGTSIQCLQFLLCCRDAVSPRFYDWLAASLGKVRTLTSKKLLVSNIYTMQEVCIRYKLGHERTLKIKESGNGRRIRDVPKQTCFVVAERNCLASVFSFRNAICY